MDTLCIKLATVNILISLPVSVAELGWLCCWDFFLGSVGWDFARPSFFAGIWLCCCKDCAGGEDGAACREVGEKLGCCFRSFLKAELKGVWDCLGSSDVLESRRSFGEEAGEDGDEGCVCFCLSSPCAGGGVSLFLWGGSSFGGGPGLGLDSEHWDLWWDSFFSVNLFLLLSFLPKVNSSRQLIEI